MLYFIKETGQSQWVVSTNCNGFLKEDMLEVAKGNRKAILNIQES